MARLWGGRFKTNPSLVSQNISQSISYDKKLYKEDILASTIHANMLMKQGIINKEEFNSICDGLQQIKQEIKEKKLPFDIQLEDIHTHIEHRLVEIIGDVGKKLHTARSRNDQVAVDTHLYLRKHATKHFLLLKNLLFLLLDVAHHKKGLLWVGYTHLQLAQPVFLSHYILSYFWKFLRDLELLKFIYNNEINCSPLGCAALAGANYNIDRSFTANELKFRKLYFNSMDAVSNRDYQLSYHFFASRLFIHISQFCEDIILYNSIEFSYITLGDAVTTGSSIMPQKKNPDIAELLRGKSARVVGNLSSLLMNLKGLPSTYNRDLQEDKVYLFSSISQVEQGLLGLMEIIKNVEFHPENVIKNLKKGFTQATDFADFLVAQEKVPFRKAHEITGKLVKYCEENNKYLEDLHTKEIQTLLKQEINSDISFPDNFFDLKKSVNRKQGIGSTNMESIEHQIDYGKEIITTLEL